MNIKSNPNPNPNPTLTDHHDLSLFFQAYIQIADLTL